jgi:histone H3/H4
MGLPTRPTKTKDPRSRGFGSNSVEVDAIRAPVLRRIIRDAIEQHLNADALEATREAEQAERETIAGFADTLNMQGE